MTDIFAERGARPMLIGLCGEAFDSPEYIFELKMDGERCLAYVDGAETILINRRGRSVLPQFPELRRLHEQVGGRAILDGELVAGVGSKADFETIKRRSSVKRPCMIGRLSRESPVTFVAVDILYHENQLVVTWPWWRRRELLERAVREGGGLAVVRTVAGSGTAFFDTVREQGLEGIIAKRRDSVYRMGKRTRDWMKIKNWIEDDFIICGFMENKGAVVASLVLGRHVGNGGMEYKGRVALSGGRGDFHAVKALRRAGRPCFRGALPEGSEEATWVEPCLVCRVRFLCWLPGGRLRQPHYVRLTPEVAAEMVVEKSFRGCNPSHPIELPNSV